MNIKRLIMITFLFACYGAGMVGSNKIDRKALVMRHNVTQTHIDQIIPSFRRERTLLLYSRHNGDANLPGIVQGRDSFIDHVGMGLASLSEYGKLSVV